MTPLQLKNLGIARRWAEKSIDGFDEAQFRLVLRNVGQVQEDATGHVSSKALSNSGLEIVMAWFESVGWEDPWKEKGYWQGQVKRQGGRQEYSVAGLIEKYQISDAYLAGIIRRITHDRTNQVSGCNAYEQGKIIEALKAIGNRPHAKLAKNAENTLLFDPNQSRIDSPRPLRPLREVTSAELSQIQQDEIPI